MDVEERLGPYVPKETDFTKAEEIAPKELKERYQAGERYFAGIRFANNSDDTVLWGTDLCGIVLSGAYLPSVRLKDINLSFSQLRGVYMPDSDLTLADLSSTDLTGATLKRACLKYANLANALLEGTNLKYANLEGADTTYARFDYSILCQVDMSQVWRSHPHPHCPNALLWETTMPDGTFIAGPKYE